MRVGLITQLLWPRYGHFWETLLGHAGMETLKAGSDRLRRAMNDERLESVPGLVFQWAVAQAIALQDSDIILAPDLNAGEESARGGGQDPWIASFPEALATRFAGLPPVLGVPVTLGQDLEPLAISSLQRLTHDPALSRRAWEKSRGLAKPARYPEPRWTLQPSEKETVGLIGQPWLVDNALAGKLRREGQHLVAQHQLDPVLLRQEGARVDDKLLATDRETLGAARLLARKGSVSRLIMVVDKTSGSDAWLANRVERSLHKPLERIYLQDLLD